ncbi:MAG TPA: hypothetical protein VMT20_13875 [Terriglobia bacterium]|nr:hypothetical protein [Terriglobia bacterium]
MLRAGWSLVWRRQRLLWWIYIISLGLSFFAAQPLVKAVGPVLDNSLAADRLYHHFDLGALAELLARPEIDSQVLGGAPILAGAVFVVLMVLFTGGILKVYHEDRTFTTGEFFGAGGQFFWRFVRLVIFLLLVLIPVAIIRWVFRVWSDNLSDHFAAPAPHMAVSMIGGLVVLFLLMSVRLWFDMAEVGAVAEDEYAMRRSVVRAFHVTWTNLRSLFWLYFRPILVAALGTALVLWVWIRWVSHQAVSTSFFLSQAVILLWIFARLWQRSSEVLWYQQYAPEAGAFPELASSDSGPAMEAPPAPEVPRDEVSM